MTLEGPRILGKPLDGCHVQNSPDDPSVTSTIAGDNWVKLSETVMINRSYYDLSGYNRKELTSFFAGIDIQEEFGTYGALPGYLVDLITTEYITDADAINAHISEATALDSLPGFPRSTFDMNQVIYGRTRSFYTSADWALINQYSTTNWGTCRASTADKIHLTRIIFTDPNLPENQAFIVPPCNYVASIVVTKEEDLTFLMRQKRSYELATGP